MIRLTSERGLVGWGEASPLPGFSRETLDEVRGQLAELRSRLQGRTLPPDIEQMAGSFEEWLREYALWPSARFGVEAAVLDLLSVERQTPLHVLLGAARHQAVPVNALVSGSPEEVIRAVTEIRQSGYRAVKLKVGHDRMETEIALVRRICDLVKDSMRVRLDANRAWSLAEAISFAEGLTGCDIEYLEEPCRTDDETQMFARRSNLEVALDETLAGITPEKLGGLQAAAVVLKPTILGGVEKTMRFAVEAKRLAVKPVVSSSYETSLGMRVLAHLAAALDDDDTPVGLDTTRWFARDLLQPPMRVAAGRMMLPQEPDGAVGPDPQCLREITDE